jgi:threonine dehydrogenase-like Zn-dependent dehydrogenase
MNELRRVSLSLGVAAGPAGTFYVALIGLTDAKGRWHARELKGSVDGDVYTAAEVGLLAALAKMAEPSRVVGAVSSGDIADHLRHLINAKRAVEPHQVTINSIQDAAPYADAVVECDARARELAVQG